MEITARPFQKVGQPGGIFGKAGLFPPKALNLQLPFATYFSVFSDRKEAESVSNTAIEQDGEWTGGVSKQLMASSFSVIT